jgi:hypothetical protein
MPQSNPIVSRTKLQRDADMADCDLYRLISRVESIYDEVKARSSRSAELQQSLMSLRKARGGIRLFMHDDDRKRT